MRQIFLTFLFIFPGILAGQTLYYPPNTGNQWDTIDPSSLGYCDDKIDSLYNFLDTQNSKAFILLKDGKIVLEKYFGSFTQDSLWYWASAGKTLTAAVVGVAQQENYLNIMDSSSKYLGSGWTVSPKESLISIQSQLSMNSGLDDGVSNVDCTYDTCLQYLADPGNRWAYHNGPYTLLDSIIYYSTGQSINQYLIAKIRNPIGMNGAYVKLGFNNVYFSNSRSMARFGLLLLGKGDWNGSSILADSVYFSEMINSSQNLNPSYGYLTWLNGKSTYMVPGSQISLPGPFNVDAPTDMYAAMGKNGQLLNIVPSQNLIWMRMGNPPNSGGGLIAPFLNNDIWKHINDLVCITNVEEYESDHEIRIFPIPAKDYLKVEFASLEQNVDYSVTDLRGRILRTGYYSNKKEFSVDLDGLEPAFYILKIKTERAVFSEKFLVSAK